MTQGLFTRWSWLYELAGWASSS